MPGERVSDTPVRTKAVLVDPTAMRVSWVNESASAGSADGRMGIPGDIPIDELIPATRDSSAADLVRAVAETGIPQHLRADVITTGKGSLSMVTSLYRLPDGGVLVLTENTWLLDKEESRVRRSSDSRRRR